MGLHLLVRWLYLSGLMVLALIPLTGYTAAAALGPAVSRALGTTALGRAVLSRTAPARTALGTSVLSRAVLGTTVSDVLGTIAIVLLDLVFTVAFFVLVERAVTGFRAIEAALLLDLSGCRSGGMSGTGRCRPWLTSECSTAPPSKASSGGCSGCGSAAGFSTTAAPSWNAPWSRSASECTLDVGSILQCHSLEGGTFKSDRITVGDRCTIGTGAFVHYGVTLDDGAVLDADSFLMKGEHVPPGARWRGNPAAAAQAGRTSPARPLPPGPALSDPPPGQLLSYPPPPGQRPSYPPSPPLTTPRSPARAPSHPS